MEKLKHPYISHINDGRKLYGGNQALMHNRNTRQCGCGIIAVLDTLIYLHLYHSSCAYEGFENIKSAAVEHELYEELTESLHRKYFPLIPHFGTNGLMISMGLNRIFKSCNMPFRARLFTEKGKTFEATEELLRNDIPVILLIGSSFPAVWVKAPLTLYSKTAEGEFIKSAAVSSHYVTVTGMDEEYLQVSSWGNQYFISRTEFEKHSHEHSIELFNTIIHITRQKND